MVLDIVAVAAASIAGMAVGAAWFSRALFGKKWAAVAGVTLGASPGIAYLWAFVATAATATTLSVAAHVVAAAVEGPFLIVTLATGLVGWLGFTVARSAVEYLFEQRPVSLFAIDMGHQLAVITVMSIIIGLLAF